jgi:hypothetical protein
MHISSAFAAANLDLLEANNITHIINMAAELSNHFPDRFAYLHIHAQDSLTERLSPQFPTITKFASSSLASNPEAQILMHCQQGVSRSAAAALAILIENENLRLEPAFHLLKSKRSMIEPNRTFLMELRWLEKDVFGDVTSTKKLTFLDEGGLVEVDWTESMRQILANAAIGLGQELDWECGMCGLIWSAIEEDEKAEKEKDNGLGVLGRMMLDTFRMFGGRQGRDYRARETLSRVLEYGYVKKVKIGRDELVRRMRAVMNSNEFLDLCTDDTPLAYTWGKELIVHLQTVK